MGERKVIGNKLKELREKAGLRQSQVADYLENTQSYLSKIEAGERAISVEQLEKLVELYGHDMSILEAPDRDVKPIQMALRAKDLSKEDLQIMSVITRIANNCRFMTKLLEENE